MRSRESVASVTFVTQAAHLQLDDAADLRSSAEDWFTYGQFLDTAGFPARFVMPVT